MQGSPSKFRPDIEGLRCIAVLAVLLYHLDPSWLPGGFQGVDIFFVISGYLITGVILDKGDGFSFRRFYGRRFWRLFPSLATVIAGTLIGAYFVLSPTDYRMLGTSAFTALTGVSNFFFYSRLDYFNDYTVAYPLLHTWSLGIEEQFYLFWPFLIVAAGRRISLPALIAGMLVAAIAFNMSFAGIDPQFAFYMMPFRIFEFSAGAAVLLFGPHLPEKGRLPGGLLGGVLIAGSLVMIGENRVWPGAAALLPVAGAALLLWAGSMPLWTAALGNPAFRFVGRISYVLYLVHWPIIVLYRYWRVVPLTLTELAVLAALCLASAVLFHVAVETPFREGRPAASGLSALADFRRFAGWRKARMPALGAVTLTTLVMATIVWLSDGMPGRVITQRAQRSEGQLSYAGDICNNSRSRRCILGDAASRRRVYVVGDSHAGNLFYGLDRLFRQLGIKGIGLWDNGCLFLFDTTRFIKGRYDRDCARNIADAFSVMGADNAPVILAGNASGYDGAIGFATDDAPIASGENGYHVFIRRQLIASLKRLHADRRPVMLVKSAYDSGIDTARCLSKPGSGQVNSLNDRCKPWSLARNLAASAQIDAIIEEAARQFAGASTIDPKSAFCSDSDCTVIKAGAFLMRDSTHLTNDGSAFLIERLKSRLVDWLGKRYGAL